MDRMSIRFRLMVLMICLTTIPVITVTLIAANNTKNSVEKEIINANNSRMEWVDQYLNELIDQIDVLFYSLQIDEQLMNELDEIDSPYIDIQYRTQNIVKEKLMSVFHSNSRKVDELTLYMHSSQKAFTVSFASSGTVTSFDICKGVWSRIQKPINMYFKQTVSEIYAFHSVNRFPDKKLLGGLSVKINKSVWKEAVNILKSEPNSSVYFINDEGELLSGSSEKDIPEEIRSMLSSHDTQSPKMILNRTMDDYYFIKSVGDGQLTVVKVVPSDTINRSAQATVVAGILTGSLFAAVSLLLAILVSLRISRPIVSLARTMKMTQIENFEMKAVKSRDEIGLLERGYNSMMQRIKQLIEGQYQKEIEVKNAQLMALQAQINPHFLNNTLNLIGGIALSKKVPEIYQISRVVADLLRYSISIDGNMVTLDDEIRHTQNYIYIQERRFAGRCTVVVSAEESVLMERIPKFTLQPMVENAFEHGLQPREGAWRLEIRVKRIGNRIVILVKDNGVGMEFDRLLQIRTELKNGLLAKDEKSEAEGSKKRKGIGLKNVNARLKLQFGERYGVWVYSRKGKGTLVVLALPAAKREDKKDV